MKGLFISLFCLIAFQTFAQTAEEFVNAGNKAEETPVQPIETWEERHKKNEYEALDYYNKAIKVDPNYLDAYRARAFIYLNQKKYYLAMSDCNFILKIEPNDPFILFRRGVVKFEQKDYLGAILDLDETIKLTDKSISSTAYFVRGVSKQRLGRKTEGCLDVSKAGELGCVGWDIGEYSIDDNSPYGFIKKYCK